MHTVLMLGVYFLSAAEPSPLVLQLLEQNAQARALVGDVEMLISFEETRYTSHEDAARMEAGLAAEGITLPNGGVAAAVGGQRIVRGTAMIRQSGEFMSGNFDSTSRNLASGYTEQRSGAGAINSQYVTVVPSMASPVLTTTERIEGRLPIQADSARERMGPNMLEMGFAAGDILYLDELIHEDSTRRDWEAEPYTLDGSEGYLITVTMTEGRYGGARNEYFIDPNRGHLITQKTAYDHSGNVLATYKIRPEEVEPGVWFPKEVRKTTDSEQSVYKAESVAIHAGLDESMFDIGYLISNPEAYTRIHQASDGSAYVQRFINGEWTTIQNAAPYTPQAEGIVPGQPDFSETPQVRPESETASSKENAGSKLAEPQITPNESAASSKVAFSESSYWRPGYLAIAAICGVGIAATTVFFKRLRA